MKFFTADTHFGHMNVIKYCDRPFKNIEVMNQTIIENFNKIVKNDDDLYIIGDLSLWPPSYRFQYEEIFKAINGKVHLIAGNHDLLRPQLYIDYGADSYHYPYLEINEGFILCHDPVLCQNIDKWCLVGHVHNLFLKKGMCINVGVDVHDFKPISIKEIEKIIDR